jgi:hypothetical protein
MDPTAITTPAPVEKPAANTHVNRQVPQTRQAVTGVVPPELGEAMIREVWPSVTASGPAIPSLARALQKSIILAPLGWLLLLPLFVKRIMPFICTRYTLTNRQLMIQRGLKPAPAHSLRLQDIDDVRVVDSTRDRFYLSATLEVISGGKVALTLPGVPEPEGFRQAIRNAVAAWVPGKSLSPFISATGVKSEGIFSPASSPPK